ncbi:MAG: AAA family ATPase, partial [Butyrivibrio sp.]|nr:AAA family ATPase [Butyrivibrio sp.]
VLSGSLAIKEGAIKYKSAKYKAELDLVSVSTGIKSFIILKELLMNGSIEENGIIVIDEPEVHLHPEWQVRYAEIIVMLQKYYGLNILLTTHSDEFLSAIQLYSKRYGVEETCHYYMAKLKPSKTADDLPLSCFEESTRDLEEIYASLSQPYLDVYSQLNEEE